MNGGTPPDLVISRAHFDHTRHRSDVRLHFLNGHDNSLLDRLYEIGSHNCMHCPKRLFELEHCLELYHATPTESRFSSEKHRTGVWRIPANPSRV